MRWSAEVASRTGARGGTRRAAPSDLIDPARWKAFEALLGPEIGEELGKPSYLIDDAEALDPAWFAAAKPDGIMSVGVTAGASAPEMLVQGVIEGLRQFGEVDVSTLAGVAEDVRFRFPAQLADA